MAKKSIQNQQVDEPFIVPDVLSEASIWSTQKDFPIREVDYVHLKQRQPATLIVSTSFFFAGLGYAYSIIAKLFEETTVKNGEWITLAIGMGLALLIFLIGHFLQNPKKKLMKDMEEHFRKAPISRQAFKGMNNDD